jgi:hypothetical protein
LGERIPRPIEHRLAEANNEWHLWRSKKPKRFRFDVGFDVRGGKANLRVAML